MCRNTSDGSNRNMTEEKGRMKIRINGKTMELIRYLGESSDHFMGSLVFIAILAWAVVTVIEAWKGDR
jgi:hypothetical protein